MIKALVIILVLSLSLIVLIRLFESKLVFFPTKFPSGFWQPEKYGLVAEDVWVESGGGVQIHGWFVRHPEPVAALLLAHGNGGNLSDRWLWLQAFHQHLPVDLLIFDYRGYGRSNGSPSEGGCYEDAIAIYDWLRQRHPEQPIIAHGHSLGGAVVIDLATQRELKGLIVESSFTNATDMARLMFGFLPLQLFSTMKWDNVAKARELTIPKLFLHGDRDAVIPFELGLKLYEAAAEPKQFVVMKGVDHNNTFIAGGEDYYRAIYDFVLSCVRQPGDDSHAELGDPQ